MNDPFFYLTLATAALVGIAIVATATLTGWRDWLALKQQEIAARTDQGSGAPAGTRIELADLKERLKKLEAIAAGVDL